MLGKLVPNQIDDLLHSQIVGRIGCHCNNETYIVPISYAYDGQYIYCHTDEGKKIDILRQNPKVCFEVDDIKDMANWRSAIVQGRFEEIKLPDERAVAIRLLLNRNLPMTTSVKTRLGKYWPFSTEEDVEGIVFRITITDMNGRFESNLHTPTLQG